MKPGFYAIAQAGAAQGEPQPVDIGLGPMFIRLNWLADPM